MKLNIYLILAFMLASTSVHSQTALPYYTGFDNASQQSGWQQFRKGSVANNGWNFHTFNAYSAPNELNHFYPVGGSSPTDDWFVSPMFDFSSGARIDSMRHLFTGFGNPNVGDTLTFVLLNGSPDPDLATSKTVLMDYTINYVHDNIWHLDTNINIPATAGQSYVAFRYKTIINWFDLIFDNLSISGNPTGFVPDNIFENVFLVYPNPANDFLLVENRSNMEMNSSITDMSGRIVCSIPPHENKIDVSGLEEGIYFLTITADGKRFTKKLVKE